MDREFYSNIYIYIYKGNLNVSAYNLLLLNLQLVYYHIAVKCQNVNLLAKGAGNILKSG